MGVWRVVIQVAQGIASALAPVVKFVVDTFPAAWNLARAIIGKAIEGLAVDAKIKFAIISTAIQAAAKGNRILCQLGKIQRQHRDPPVWSDAGRCLQLFRFDGPIYRRCSRQVPRI
jgi:hypothetical protein